MGAFGEQIPQIAIAGFSDPQLRILVSGLTTPRAQSQIASYRPAMRESVLVSRGQHEGEGGQRSHAVDRNQGLCLPLVHQCHLEDQAIISLNLLIDLLQLF